MRLRILFVCDGRFSCSAIAAVFAQRLSHGRVEAYHATPGGTPIHPMARITLSRFRFPDADAKSTRVAVYSAQIFDLAIGIGPGAADLLDSVKARRSISWDIHEPSEDARSIRKTMMSFRRLSFELRNRVELLVAVEERRRRDLLSDGERRTVVTARRHEYPPHRSRNDGLPWPRAFIYHAEPTAARALHLGLEVAGFRVASFSQIEAALAELAASSYDLLLISLPYPAPDGLTLLRRFQPYRQGRLGVVGSATGLSDLERKIAEAIGVTHWVSGDMSARETIEKVAGIVSESGYLRSSAMRLWCPRSWSRFLLGPVLVDSLERFAQLREQKRKLSALQSRLLVYFAENNAGHPEKEILSDVWGLRGPIPETKRVYTTIHTVRDMFLAEGKLIEWVRGVGFRLSGPFAEIRPAV